MKITKKYLDFLKTDSEVDVLEGTTQSGKTTTAASTKFLYMIKKTKRNKHLIAGESLGTVLSNILSTGDCGLLDNYPDIELYLNGNHRQKLPHLQIGEDTVYLVGYSDIAKFKKVLGGQFGAVFIDEVNIADMGFIRELFLPRFEYMCMTLNPDNPDKEIYNEIINRARPIEKYEKDVPNHIWEELKKSLPTEMWRYWFFTFDDNPAMTEELKHKLLTSLLPETREYQTKIQGIRTKGVGLIFNLPTENIITEEEAKKFIYKKYTCGVDTSYSRKSNDTFTFMFGGITDRGVYVALEERVFNNKDRAIPLTPSDIAVKLSDFIINMQKKWGTCPDVFIDNADQATITECRKYKLLHGFNFNFLNSYKKMKIIDRINLQNSWIAHKNYLIVGTCTFHIKEHNTYSWDTKKDEPEDANDHTINGSQYGWIPFKKMIGSDQIGIKKYDRQGDN
ncbi:MAG: hypothetical protein KAX49_07275 [Halanaerobiales bacterium]|nr:hypothetical protein [Halanaerobiales bacterium]